jgi:hypothetical protein
LANYSNLTGKAVELFRTIWLGWAEVTGLFCHFREDCDERQSGEDSKDRSNSNRVTAAIDFMAA